MSWKLSTLAIAVTGLLASSLTAVGKQATRPTRGPQDDPSAVAASGGGPSAAAAPSDKDLIEKQKICPVTDQPLGSMGKPVKVVVKNRTVFLCCAGCKKKLLADPDKYLKKLAPSTAHVTGHG